MKWIPIITGLVQAIKNPFYINKAILLWNIFFLNADNL